MSFFQNIKHELSKHNILTILLVLNISLFLVINLDEHIFNLGLLNLLELPLDLSRYITRFWTIFTYMFSHKDLGHVFYNMLLLYFSAKTFLNFLPEKKLLYIYLMSGLFGGLILLILSAIAPAIFYGSYLIGASAAVIGIVMCMAMYVPNISVSLFGIIEMKYKHFALLIFVLSSIVDFTINTGGKISHFGGAFFGLFYGYMLRNGKDISQFTLFNFKKKENKLKVVHSNKTAVPGSPANENQQTIDALLDKISKNGYDSLTKTEKELLFKLSQKK